MKKNKAFTLAEVLITLVIIGVIAAITVPTIIANSQEQEIKTALKKAHSIIQQALKFYYIDYGEFARGSDFEPRTFKEVFKRHFNVMNDYGINGYFNANKNQDNYKTLNGNSNLNYYIFDDGQFDLIDGMFIMIENPSFGEGNNRVFIAVDVNGHDKKPNRLGKDLFFFQVNNEGQLAAMGEPGTFYSEEEYCSSTSSDSMNGAGCTAKMLRKN